MVLKSVIWRACRASSGRRWLTAGRTPRGSSTSRGFPAETIAQGRRYHPPSARRFEPGGCHSVGCLQ